LQPLLALTMDRPLEVPWKTATNLESNSLADREKIKMAMFSWWECTSSFYLPMQAQICLCSIMLLTSSADMDSSTTQPLSALLEHAKMLHAISATLMQSSQEMMVQVNHRSVTPPR